jgi:hypothetical protein
MQKVRLKLGNTARRNVFVPNSNLRPREQVREVIARSPPGLRLREIPITISQIIVTHGMQNGNSWLPIPICAASVKFFRVFGGLVVQKSASGEEALVDSVRRKLLFEKMLGRKTSDFLS